MSRRSTLGMIVALILLSPFVLAGIRGTFATTLAAPAGKVTIQNFAFSPAVLKVALGTTVTWTNQDSVAHTVTSDTNAWADSGSLATGKTFSVTFNKAGSFAYHCAIHPTMTAQVLVGGAHATGGSSRGMTGMGPMSMGPMSMTSMHAWTGYYDDHPVLYISTDTSSKAEAARDHINYSAALAKTLPQASSIYLVTNGGFAGHGAVFGSAPGKSDYTPLWQEVTVTWKNPAKAVALGSDNQILALAKAGTLTTTNTGVVLNCPIIKALKGGM
ncbi:MAG TPA: cupredoxin family copper-binding protein [Chloroflexota bacterium]